MSLERHADSDWAAITVTGAADFAYVGAIASGWMSLAIQRAGSPRATVRRVESASRGLAGAGCYPLRRLILD